MPAFIPEGDLFYDIPDNMNSDARNASPPPPRGPLLNVLRKTDVVISGMSGRFPESENIEAFARNLYEATDMVTEDSRRWPPGLFGLPTRSGKLPDIVSFDASFFAVHGKQAHAMDPQLRLLLELVYEAIIDAGINPENIRGSRTGVFVGASESETLDGITRVPNSITGYELTGCCRSMFANRISYTFDLKGPSYQMDTACSSSLLALQQAHHAISTGLCDSAVVAGVHLNLKPQYSLQFERLGMLSSDGKCKAFDSSGNGYVRSEAAAVVFLQRQPEARRIYASLIHAKTNTDGFKDQGVTYPSGEMQKNLLLEVYEEAGVQPQDVAYVEAHGTGTKVGDPQELNAIADVFCKGRNTPLLIGSVKSNVGHAEPASGMCQVVKTLLAMESGVIPGNLHFKNANPNIPALSDGRLQVVNKNMPWSGGYVGINSFGFGGSNVHVLLKSPSRNLVPPPAPPSPVLHMDDGLSRTAPQLVDASGEEQGPPELIVVSGRTEEAVRFALDGLEAFRLKGKLAALDLIGEIGSHPISGHPYRGYSITRKGVQVVTEVPAAKRPLWFLYSGMGTQWVGMGKELMAIPAFETSLRQCANTLAPLGMNLMNLVMNGKDTDFDDCLNSFVVIAAIQIAMTDVLSDLGIHPDGFLGHSTGEMLCAYADGCHTLEQTIRGAYWRGRGMKDSDLPEGAMAAVGLTWEDAHKRCPEGVFPACHNSHDNITVSGPKEKIQEFVRELKEEGVFAKEVNSSKMAFHSKYIGTAAEKFRCWLKKEIPSPRRRSQRWISSSIPESEWNTERAIYSSAEYHVNNVVSPVLFQSALKHIPENAVVVEIAPHALLMAILKRSLPGTVTCVPLNKRNCDDNLKMFLTAIGEIYVNGKQAKVHRLFRLPSFPVPRGTPSLSSLVKWDHSTEWNVVNLQNFNISQNGQLMMGGEFRRDVDLSDPDQSFISGHNIDGRILYPATGYLRLAWEALAKIQGKAAEEIPVEFSNVHLRRATILNADAGVCARLSVSLALGSGQFEISEGGGIVVDGAIRIVNETDGLEAETFLDSSPQPPSETLTSKEVYRELLIRGYEYRDLFQGIQCAAPDGRYAEVSWKGNWVPFLDNLLQVIILGEEKRALKLPTKIQRMRILPQKHLSLVGDSIPAVFDHATNTCLSGGVEIRGCQASIAPRRPPSHAAPTLESYRFVPFVTTERTEVHEDLCFLANLILQNHSNSEISIGDTTMSSDSLPMDKKLSYKLFDSLRNHPNTSVSCTIQSAGIEDAPDVQDLNVVPALTEKVHILFADEYENGSTLTKDQSFLVIPNESTTKVESNTWISIGQRKSFNVLKRRKASDQDACKWISVDDVDAFKWLQEVKGCMVDDKYQQIYIVSKTQNSGILGLINCLKLEPTGGHKIRGVSMIGEDLSKDVKDMLLERDLNISVLRDGIWGTYIHQQIDFKEATEKTTKTKKDAFLNTLVRGDLSSLTWIESSPSDSKATDGEVICNVEYAPLNFRDVMLATGKLPPDALPGDLATQECVLGLEFAGTVPSSGKRVMGLVPAKGLATSVRVDPSFMWEVPEHWTMQDAATVPVVYSTAYYSLIVRGRLQPGETVLIHSGSGGVGQAAIAISLSLGCRVFTTVGSDQKKEFLLKRFPKLNSDDILNSRSTKFEVDILQKTNGKGVDIALNSLAEEKLQATVRTLAEHGRFLEIGKFDLSQDHSLGMAIFLKNVTFHGILLDALFEVKHEKQAVVSLVQEGIKSGVVTPLPCTVFDATEAEAAFRFMASGKHLGKVVLSVASPSLRKEIFAPRAYCRPDHSYIITGGLGGFGLELAEWLITRGAKYLTLTSRTGVRTAFQRRRVSLWKKRGICVKISTEDISNYSETCALLRSSPKPVDGIFHLAMVLKDGLIENQTPESYKSVFRPKAAGALNLDAASRELNLDLRWFVCFSSVSCGRGNAGQSNYGLANSVMERVCENRNSDGLAGLSVQWGAIGDVGVVLDSMAHGNEEIIGGTQPQRIRSCMETLEKFLCACQGTVASTVWAQKSASSRRQGSANASLADSVARILGLGDVSKIDPNVTLGNLGMDSLMGVEVRQLLERVIGSNLQMNEVRDLTFGKLVTQSSTNAAESKSPANKDIIIVLRNTEHGILLLEEQSLVLLNEADNLTKKPLFIVHPIDGTAKKLKTLAQHIKDRSVYGFQCTTETPMDNMDELAKHYIKLMKEVQPEGPFHLCGYSFGACVALAMAKRLEKSEIPVLYLIDGSHEYTTVQFEEYTKHMSSEELNNELFIGFLSQFATFDVMRLRDDIKRFPTWESKATRVAAILSTNGIQMEVTPLEKAVESFHKRFLVAHHEVPKGFSGRIFLLRAKDNPLVERLGRDYGLSKETDAPLKIVEVSGDHDALLSDQVEKTATQLISAMMEEGE